jgi:hypothetical protein
MGNSRGAADRDDAPVPARKPADQAAINYVLTLWPDLALAGRFWRGEVDQDGQPVKAAAVAAARDALGLAPDAAEPAPAQGTGTGSALP